MIHRLKTLTLWGPLVCLIFCLTAGPALAQIKVEAVEELPGKLRLVCNIDGTKVTLAGATITARAGKAMVLGGVPAGELTVTATKEGYQTWSGRVNIVSGKTAFLEIKLQPLQATFSRAEVIGGPDEGAGPVRDIASGRPAPVQTMPPPTTLAQAPPPTTLAQAPPPTTAPPTPADRINRLLAEADEDVKAYRLTSPKGDNALDKYRRVLELEPGNRAAEQGLGEIVSAYLRLFDRAVGKKQFDKADGYLDSASKVAPDQRLAEAAERLKAARAEEQTRADQRVREEEKVKKEKQASNLPKSGHNSIGMNFILCPAGEFMMGSPSNHGYADERPQHKVTISRPFYIGVNEVTQQQYQRVMGINPADHQMDTTTWKPIPTYPVEMVTWDQAAEFCRRLTALEGARRYRLPTEAEWEYAARAAGNYWGPIRISQSATLPVGKTKRNRWNIYDLAGNVWEWTADWYDSDYYSKSPASDPRGPDRGSEKVIRGGGYDSDPDQVRSNGRDKRGPYVRAKNLGFRVVLETK